MSSSTRLAVAAAGATVLSAICLGPLFESQQWLLPMLATVAVVSIAGMLSRRAGVPRPVVPLLQLVTLTLWLGVLYSRGSGTWGFLPDREWALALYRLGAEGFAAINQYAAPVPHVPSLVALTVAGVALVALAVDFLAATLRQASWAGLPLLALYAVPTAVVPGGVTWLLFVTVAVGYLWLLVADGRERLTHWGRPISFATDPGTDALHTASLTAAGRRVGAAVVGIAVVVPALLPGLPENVFGNGSGIGGSGDGGGEVISTDNPIVDLKRDLTRPDNVEVLRYQTDDPDPDYVRIVALDVFDGTQWKTSDRSVPDTQTVSAGLPPPPGLSNGIEREAVVTNFAVADDLESRWLPLQYPATSIEVPGDWRFDQATLDVVSPDTDTAGLSYSVNSLDLALEPEQLAAAGPAAPAVEEFTELPEDMDPMVGDLARRVTADAANPYEQAVALQRWFRVSGNFTYDLATVEPGTSSSALVEFLEDRRGYCEQYAAAMGIMARALGIPARVGVGFLPGLQDSEGSYVVRANDAHSWPELYFEGAGWVRFEPTPATRVALPPAYTNTGFPITPEPDAGQEPGRSPTTNDPTGGSGRNPAENLKLPETAAAGEPQSRRDGMPSWQLVAVAAGLALLAVPSVVRVLVRRRRWADADSNPARAAEAAWSELRDAVRDSGQRWDPAATPRATATALAAGVTLSKGARAALARIATATERARYARAAQPVATLREDTDRVRAALRERASWAVRLRALLWPAACRDLLALSGTAIADALDWLDLAGYRLRQRLTPRRLAQR